MSARTIRTLPSPVLRVACATPLFLALGALPASAQGEVPAAQLEYAFSLCFQLELADVGTDVTADSCTEAVEIPQLHGSGTGVHVQLCGSYEDRPFGDDANFERRFGLIRAVRRTTLPSGEVHVLEDNHVLSWKTVAYRWSESRARFVPWVRAREGEPTAWLAELLRGDLDFRWFVPGEGAKCWTVDGAALVGDLWPLRWGELAAEPAAIGTHGIAPVPRLDVGLALPVLFAALEGSVTLRPGPEDTTLLHLELRGEDPRDDLVPALLAGTRHEAWLPFVSYWNEASLTLKGHGTAHGEPGRLDSVRIRARLDLEQELGWEHWWDGPSQVQGRHRERWTGDMVYRWEAASGDAPCPHEAGRS